MAFVHSAIYALVMPPWGILDEEQHFDYILKVTQTGHPPVTNVDLLDSKVVQSILDVQRHARLHWPVAKLKGPGNLDLEAYSYEGYHGPVFYYLNAPFFLLIPGGILDKLFGLRLVMILFSLASVWCMFRITSDLFPNYPDLPYWVAFLIICIPEWTSTSARVSNDVLLEVLSILFLWLFTYAIMKGISWKTAAGLGLLSGLGVLTKVSFVGVYFLLPVVFLLNLREKQIIAKGALTLSLIAVLLLPFFYYNLRLYGNLTGFAGFSDLYSRYGTLWNPPLNLRQIMVATWQLFRGFWLIWWESAISVNRAFLYILWVFMIGVCLTAAVGLVQKFRHDFSLRERRCWALLAYAAVILLYIGLVLAGYFQGTFPVMQGRFLLPVIFPIVLFICLGLKQVRNSPYLLILTGGGVLLVFDALNNFGHLLPFFYYFSAFYQNGEALPIVWHGWREAASLFFSNFISDKPSWVILFGLVSLFFYALLLPFVFFKGFQISRCISSGRLVREVK
ncbi:MAG TPA: glycosyltransferase family 39 protein [Bacteroidales bacterium]|nr:glycosyltransferase family 39 protein [Bacteroidales bacterium]